VEIAGNEYTYAGGAGIFAMSPKVAPGAVFRESIPLGTLVDAPRALRRALDILKPDFGPDDYSLVKNNCNHFVRFFPFSGEGGWDREDRWRAALHVIPRTNITLSPSFPPFSPPCVQQANALVMELLGKPIPGYLNRLASFGSFFSCFLPADMTSQAPVNQGA